jgi:hypothetical protein
VALVVALELAELAFELGRLAGRDRALVGAERGHVQVDLFVHDLDGLVVAHDGPLRPGARDGARARSTET